MISIVSYLNGERYPNLLKKEIEKICCLLSNITVLFDNKTHNTTRHTTYLKTKYNFWIGRHSSLRWSFNIPELIPLDIFLWGYLKNNIICYGKPQRTEMIKTRIKEEINGLDIQTDDNILNAINRKVVDQMKIN